ncbi:MAG TPA: amino acid ABC transporter permease [Bacillota bacterium]|nr:amino acid ABC transporter permease [Bacillota bacterium]
MAPFWENIVTTWSRYHSHYLIGARNTLIISFVSTFIGCLIGFAVGIVQALPDSPRAGKGRCAALKILKIVLRSYVELFRGTPMIVQAVFIYYGARLVAGLHLDMWTAAFLIVSVNTGAYMAETVRGGILSIDPGQEEAAHALGMTHVQTMLCVILPQTFRNIIPQIGNNLIINIKDTAVLSVISITDLFFVHKSVSGSLYNYFESATIIMVIYLILTLSVSWLLRLLEKRLDGKQHYDLATTDTLAHTSGLVRYARPSEEKK